MADTPADTPARVTGPQRANPTSSTVAARGRRTAPTRTAIVDAATRRFVADGYQATTMAAIAREAGFAVQTLYLRYGSKVAILSMAHDVALAGDDADVPAMARPWMDAVRAEPDPVRAIDLLLGPIHVINERLAPIFGVIQGAAGDPDVADLYDRLRDQRRAFSRELAGILAAKVDPTGSTPDHAILAGTCYALLGTEFYRLVATESGWDEAPWRGLVRPALLRALGFDGSVAEASPGPATGLARP